MLFYSGQFDNIEFRKPSAARKIPTLFEKKNVESIIKNELKRNCKFCITIFVFGLCFFHQSWKQEHFFPVHLSTLSNRLSIDSYLFIIWKFQIFINKLFIKHEEFYIIDLRYIIE